MIEPRSSVFGIAILAAALATATAQDAAPASAPSAPSTLILGGHDAPTTIPFGLNKGRFEYQQVYERSLFPPEGMAITSVSFATAAGFGRPPHAWTGFEMVLSDSVQQVNDIERKLPRNLGQKRRVVLTRRPFEITPRADDSFDIVLPVDPPFVYRPSDGNLLVELRFGDPLARGTAPIFVRAGRVERIGFAYSVPGSSIVLRTERSGLYTKFTYVTIESLAPKKPGEAGP
jgi:hypothetical protein